MNPRQRDPLGQYAIEPIPVLSDRQRDVLVLVCRGESTKRIAIACDLTESTVKHHLKNARKKLGARNTTHAAVLFDRSQTA